MKSPLIILLGACLLLGGFAAGTGTGYLLANRSQPTAPGAPEGTEGAGSQRFGNQGQGTSGTVRSSGSQGSRTSSISAKEFLAEAGRLQNSGYGSLDSVGKWSELASRLRSSDIRKLAAELLPEWDSVQSNYGTHLILMAYAEQDPDGAWSFAQQLPNNSSRSAALQVVVSALAAKSPEKVIALMNTISDPQLQRRIRHSAITSLAQNDPARALSLLNGQSLGRDEHMLISSIFYVWGNKDPDAAVAAMKKLEGRQLDQARMSLLGTLSNKDPEAAWQLANSLGDSPTNGFDPRQQVISNWAEDDPQAALQAALQVQEETQRQNCISAAVTSWARQDIEGALNYATGISDPLLRSDVLRGLSSSHSDDPRLVLEAVLEFMPPGDNFQQAVSSLVGNLAMTDPKGAAEAAALLPPGRVQARAVSQIASQWSQTGDKKDVMSWIKTLPEGETRSEAFNSLFNVWSTQNPNEAAREIAALQFNDRPAAIRSIANSWGRVDPSAAIQWASGLGDDKEKAEAMRNVLAQWANTQPEEAAAYSRRLPEDLQASTLESIINRWASKDAESASEWLRSQPQGPARDSAISALSQKIASEDPELALGWANSISNPDQRNRQIERLSRDWLRYNHEEAKTWIQNANIPTDIKQKLLAN